MKNATFHLAILFGGVFFALLVGLGLGSLWLAALQQTKNILPLLGMGTLFVCLFPVGVATIIWDPLLRPIVLLDELNDNTAPDHEDVLRILWSLSALVGELATLVCWGGYGGWVAGVLVALGGMLLVCLSFFAYAFWKER